MKFVRHPLDKEYEDAYQKLDVLSAQSEILSWPTTSSAAAYLVRQTAGVECRKDQGVLDEIPGAYKSIETVIKNQGIW